MVNFDDILKHNVKFGSFQIRTYAIIFISPLLVGCTTFLQVFIAGVGDHWCQIPQWDQRDCDRLVGFKNETCEDILKSLSTPSLPLDDDRDPQCLTYNFTGIDLEQAYSDRNNGLLSSYDVTECNEGMVFDRSVYRSTMTEDWELVCEQSLVPNLLQSLYMAGFLLGCLLFGWLADKIGRLNTFAICNLVAGLCGVSCALAPGVIFYGIFRFITASTTYGSALVAFILATEIATPEMRVFAGVAIWYYYSAAYFVLSAAAKLIPNWRLLLALVSVPYLPLFFCVMFLTESPRWLLTKNKIEETKKAIQKMANVNGNDLSEDVISKLIEENDVTESGTPQGTFVDIIRNPVLFLYFINLAYNWFVQSFLYFGLSLGTSSLGMNVYIAFCISGAVEIPAYTISIFSMKLFGRRASTGVLMILAGISCFATIFAPLGPIRVAVAMVGKFAITASFSNIYIHTAEIFPTPLRALCVGSCSVAARIGGLVAPMILVLRELWEPLPLLLFASSSILAGLLVFFLPETKGKPMPATIQDSVNLRKVGRCDPNADDELEKDVVV